MSELAKMGQKVEAPRLDTALFNKAMTDCLRDQSREPEVCGSFNKCNNAEGCDNCEHQGEDNGQ